jgi:hypothetical protein
VKKKQYTEISSDEIDNLRISLEKWSKSNRFSQKEKSLLKLAIQVIDSFSYVIILLQKKNSSIKKLKNFIFGSKTEKREKKDSKEEKDKDSGGHGSGQSSATPPKNDEKEEKGKDPKEPPKRPGRKGGTGKNGHETYTGATEILCPLKEGHRPGDICPLCEKLPLFKKPPSFQIRLLGQAPISAFKFIFEKSGCNCGASFQAEVPQHYNELAAEDKYSPSALSSLIHSKYDQGIPFGSTSKFQGMVGIPVPAGTQSNKIKGLKPLIAAIYRYLVFLAANLDLMAFDDTPILLLKGIKGKDGKWHKKKGHGSVFVCKDQEGSQAIILYDLSLEHAGKFLFKLLSMREKDKSSLVCLCDGLKCYESYRDKDATNCNCNIHARRGFVQHDPKRENLFCELIVGNYQEIYQNEKKCRDMSSRERLYFHQENSTEAMNNILDLCRFMTSDPNSKELEKLRAQLELSSEAHPCEPNGELYGYANYILERERSLTNFLRIPGVPLDTNEVERMVKAIIEVRKKGLFFENEQSAIYAGQIISLIETAQACKMNSFDYFNFLIANQEEAIKSPEKFLPWNYQKNILYEAKRPLANCFQTMLPDNHHSSSRPVTP